MAVKYDIIEEKYRFENTCRISYGIAGYADTEKEGTATIVVSVRDVTADKEKLTRLIRICNRLKLSACHLRDVVEDFLAVL